MQIEREDKGLVGSTSQPCADGSSLPVLTDGPLSDGEGEKIGLPTPLGAIRFRMEQGGHTQADLAKLIGSRSRASEILSGKRLPSKGQIRKLVDEWGIPARSLLGPAEGGKRLTGTAAIDAWNARAEGAPAAEGGRDIALTEARDAIDFLDRVRAASPAEQIAVGHDHWDRVEAALRAVAALSPPAAEGKEDDDRELIELLRSFSAMESGWYANVGKRTGEACCRAMSRAADRIAALSHTPAPAAEPVISTDGPHKINDHRKWLARQLLDSQLSDEEAIGIVAYSPALEGVRPQQPVEISRDEIARMAWLVFGDDLSVEDAMSPRNDAHWNAWRDSEPAKSAFVMADAILSKLDPTATP